MFDKLGTALQKVFKNLRGHGKLSEKNIQDALREIRLALLEADVHFEVVRDFVARIKTQSLGREVLDSITPGQQVVKIVHDELVALLGGARRDLQLAGRPAGVMLLGLHGSGKTTTAAKLARYWKKEGRTVLLAAGDIRRPAAVEQLQILARQNGVDCLAPRPDETVPALARRAREEAERRGADVVIYDTGGRFQVDEELLAELRAAREAAAPQHALLVLDAAIGQESVQVARAFHAAAALTGIVLTKLDGDARGGAALSVQAVTGVPVFLVGTGEKPDDLEPFFPERMASRILGMGDVVSLVEKAQLTLDLDAMARTEERLRRNTFDLDDFLAQMRQVRKLGPLDKLMEMLPGGGLPAQLKAGATQDSEQAWKRTEAIICSMTPRERRRPELINAGRRRRIAAGSGTQVRDVNQVLKMFDEARRMARQFQQAQKKLRRTGLWGKG